MRLRSSKKSQGDGDETEIVEGLEIKSKVKQTSKKKLLSNGSEMASVVEKEDKTSISDKADDFHIVIRGQRINYVVLVTHINIALYSLCFWIQNGTLPYLLKELGVDTVVFGYLQTTFAVVQLCGGPIFGRFGDLFGGRAAMTLAFVAASMSYFILGFSYSIPLLFLSRLPSIFMHAMQGGQMVVTDMSDDSERADALAKLGLSYGCGMVIGPVLGGFLVKMFGVENAAFFSGFGSLLSVLLVTRFIPRHTKPKEHIAEQEASSSQVLSVRKYFNLLQIPGAMFLFIYRLVSGIPIGIFQSMFTLVAMNTFKLPPEQNGLILSYVAIITMIVQGFGIRILTKRYPEKTLLKWAAFILVWSYLALSQVRTVWQLCIVLLPMVCGLATVTIVVSSSLTKLVPVADTGVMLGLNMALNSAIRSISPTVGAIMLEYWGFPSIGYLGFMNSSIIVAVLFFKMRND